MLLDDWSGNPLEILGVLGKAAPLSAESPKPEEWTIWIDAAEPGWVIVTQIADPHWKARWIKQGAQRILDPDIRPVFRKGNESIGWQCIEVPEPGLWGLRLEYDTARGGIWTGHFTSRMGRMAGGYAATAVRRWPKSASSSTNATEGT